MGAALLIRWDPHARPDGSAQLERVARRFPERVQAMSRSAHVNSQTQVVVWSHAASRGTGLVNGPDGSWLAIVGNPSRHDLAQLNDDRFGERLLAECCASGLSALEGVSPPFAAAFFNARLRTLELSVDRCGLQHCYVRSERDGTIWFSSSSLALAAALPSTIDLEGVAEWIGIGHFLSQRTFFREIRKLGCGERLRIDQMGAARTNEWRPTAEFGGARTTDVLEREFLASLDACTPADHVVAELTGGLDSRVVLAGLLSRGELDLAWTMGQAGSRELLTVEELRRRVPFRHLRVHFGEDFAASVPDLVQSMHELSDGEVNALEYAPLLVAFEQLDGKRTASISGSGGEIARGFYYAALRDPRGRLRGISLPLLLTKLTGATSAARRSVNPETFADLGPDRVASTTIREFIRASPARSRDAILDDLYLRGRMQRFAGRNITTTGLFCRQALPYFGNDFVDTALSLPRTQKERGRALRQVLRSLSPPLASVPLDSGAPATAPSLTNPGALLREYGPVACKVRRRIPALRRLERRSDVENVPWAAVRSNPAFEEFAHEMLLSNTSASRDMFSRQHVTLLLRHSLEGGSLYPVGLLLTLELTLRRVSQSLSRGS